MRVVDLTHSISAEMPTYPGDPSPSMDAVSGYGDTGYVTRRLCLGSHTGTHVDAPAHMLPGGRTLDHYPVDHFAGPAAVVSVPAKATVEHDSLRACVDGLPADGFLLLNTGWHRLWGTGRYFHDYPALSVAAATWLVERGLRGIGVDTPSVDAAGSTNYPVHRALLGCGMVIVENLAGLDRLPEGPVWFTAFPLPLASADGSPVRAVAWLGCGSAIGVDSGGALPG